MKKFLDFVWVPFVAVALWLVYKIFVQDEENELDITTSGTGLSSGDVAIYNEVVTLMNSGGNPYDWRNVFYPFGGVDDAKNAVRLGNLLNNVVDKPLFAKVYAKKRNKLLTRDIIEVYGDKVYQLIAQNVVAFSEFII